MSTPTSEPQSPSEPAQRMNGVRRAPRWVWIAVAVAVAVAVALAVVVACVVIVTQVARSQGSDQFVTTVRLDDRVTLGDGVTDEQLKRMFETKCDLVEQGWDREDVIAAAENNWPAVESSSNVTREEFIANNVAFFDAARAAC